MRSFPASASQALGSAFRPAVALRRSSASQSSSNPRAQLATSCSSERMGGFPGGKRPRAPAARLKAADSAMSLSQLAAESTRAETIVKQPSKAAEASAVSPEASTSQETDQEEESTTPQVRVVGVFQEEEDGKVTGERLSVESSRESSRPAVLKINQDLQLYRCRTLRHKAFYVRDRAQRAKMLKEVEEGLRRAIEMDPTDGRAYVSLGKHYLQARRYDDAGKVYEDGCTATQGQNPFIWQAWATLESKRGNINKARKYYDAATVASETHVTAWHGWGQLEKRQGNYDKAQELWTKGLKKAREPNEYLYQSLGLLAQEMGRIDEARSWFRRGTEKLQGISAHAIWQAWALMEMEHGDEETVRFLFRKGLDCNKRSRYIHLAWGDWEMKLGNNKRARKILRNGNEVNPMDPAIYQALGILEQSEGDLSLARHYFKQGLEVDPTHVYLWQAWGVLEWRDGKFEEARRLFQQGIWADPKSRNVCTVFQAWGCLEKENGNVSLARNLLKCAVKANPASEISWQSWAALEESLGLYQRADDIRNFSMQERVEIITPQLTSYDLNAGKEEDQDMEGVGPTSFAKAVQQISKWVNTMTQPSRMPRY